jgi:hypothetical protein
VNNMILTHISALEGFLCKISGKKFLALIKEGVSFGVYILT